MAEGNRLPILSERQRELQGHTIVAASATRYDRDLPKDTRIKHILIGLEGGITVTYGSGTPVANVEGPFANIVDRIEVMAGGNRPIKSIKPQFLNYQQFLLTGHRLYRAASVAASVSADPTADVNAFPHPSTTEITSVREYMLLSFENPYVAKKEQFWFNTKGLSSAVLTLVVNNTDTALLGFGNTAPIATSASTLRVSFFLVEQQEDLAGLPQWDWRQTYFEKTYSSESTQQPIDLPRGARVQGVMLYTKDGAAGSATTATGKIPTNLIVTNFAVWKDGKDIIKSGTFKSQQALNRGIFGFHAPWASNLSQARGYCYIDFFAGDGRGDVDTAIDARQGQCDSLQLVINTGAAAQVSYTNPASVLVMTDELVELKTG